RWNQLKEALNNRGHWIFGLLLGIIGVDVFKEIPARRIGAETFHAISNADIDLAVKGEDPGRFVNDDSLNFLIDLRAFRSIGLSLKGTDQFVNPLVHVEGRIAR